LFSKTKNLPIKEAFVKALTLPLNFQARKKNRKGGILRFKKKFLFDALFKYDFGPFCFKREILSQSSVSPLKMASKNHHLPRNHASWAFE